MTSSGRAREKGEFRQSGTCRYRLLYYTSVFHLIIEYVWIKFQLLDSINIIQL